MALEQRGKYWRYEFMFAGRRIKKSTRLTDRAAALVAQSLHRERLARALAGIPEPQEDPPTLTEYIPTFLAWSKTLHRWATFLLHRSNCGALVRHLGAKRLDEITRADVEDFMVKRAREARTNVNRAGKVKTLKRVVSPCTVNRAVVTLKLLYRQAQGRWPELQNPCRGVKLLAEPEPQHIVTDEEWQRYLAVSPEELRDIAILMRERGLRPQDACSLTCKQCDFGEGIMELWPKPEPHLGLRVAGGKTVNSSRQVIMSPIVRDVLRRRVAEAQTLGTKFLFPMHDWRGRLIPDRHRKPNSLSKPHRNALKKAAIAEYFRLYDLRHTFATDAIRKGVNLRVVQDMLGHSDPKITMRYTKRNDLVAQRAAFSRLEG